MKNKLKKFKIKEEIICGVCHEKTEMLASVIIYTTNPFHPYKTSGRGWRNHYKFQCCQKCFNKIENKLNNLF